MTADLVGGLLGLLAGIPVAVALLLVMYRLADGEWMWRYVFTARRTLVDESGALVTLPHRDGLDGFFAVRVRRK